ncbi:MAG: Gfo/Idh/MocA family oxidoreductase [Oscillospiraceae bacterium]|nr:Gfo/Idh/MocA family oxidoreductase [Oscillospiraceae bacterium]
MKNKIRVAMLGMGGMGFEHAGNMLKMEDVEIVAMCSATGGGDRFNAEKGLNIPVYSDFDEMLDKVEMDALYVCLPPFAHNGQIEKAAAKKIAVFTEKPIAINVERAESIAKAVRENGVVSMVGYHMRFGGAVKHVRKLMEEGITGRPIMYTAIYECNSLHTPWWIKRELCGGQVFEQVIHLYDMAYYIMGEVDTVAGFVEKLSHEDVPEYTVDDSSAVSLKFKGKAMGSIVGSNCSVPGRWVGRFKIIFENCVAEFGNENNVTITYTTGEVRSETLKFDTPAKLDETRYFIDVLKGEKPEFTPIEDGLMGVRLVDAAVRSSEAGGMPIKF